MKTNYVFIPVVPANLPLIETLTKEKVAHRNLYGEHALIIEMSSSPGETPSPTFSIVTIEEIRQAFGEITSMNTTTMYHETRM